MRSRSSSASSTSSSTEAITSAPRDRRRDSGPRRHANGHDPLGRQSRLAGPAARWPPHRAVRPAGQRGQRQPGGRPRRVHVRRRRAGAFRTSSRSRWGGGSVPAWSSTARFSREMASGPARSAMSRSSTMALPATAAGSDAWRPSRAAAAIAARAAELAGELGRRSLRDGGAGDLAIDDVVRAFARRRPGRADRRSRGRPIPWPGDRGADRRVEHRPDRPRRTGHRASATTGSRRSPTRPAAARSGCSARDTEIEFGRLRAQRRRPGCVRPADHARARPEPRSMTDAP